MPAAGTCFKEESSARTAHVDMDATSRTKLAWAIENSLHWYDALCEAHGVPGERQPAFWINRHTMPPYMSNLVTLSDISDAQVQIAAIRSLSDGGTACGVKDSFQCLNLDALGFQALFHATWMFRSASSPPPEQDGDLLWRVVRTATELRAWESTWRGAPDNAEAHERPEIFRPSLLRNPDFRFLLGERDGEPVATAALNRSSHAVGLSNVFGATEEPARLFPGCVRVARAIFPDLPLVGYERGAHLVAATATGFESVHGLTVWVPAPAP
jgi:hypothetical protein